MQIQLFDQQQEFSTSYRDNPQQERNTQDHKAMR